MKAFWFVIVMVVASATFAGELPHWSYSGDTGPDAWATLCPEYGGCSGHNQSPIDLASYVDAELEPLNISYGSGGHEIVNNGHAIQVNYTPGSHLLADEASWELKQFHFHSPSENHIDGISFAMEIHLVHADDAGDLAVVAVMVEEGAANPALERLWAVMPTESGAKTELPKPCTVADLLPADRGYYRFNGSLTTPPCTEGVRWFVMRAPITASPQQIQTFQRVIGHPNNRPIQPRNARLVLE